MTIGSTWTIDTDGLDRLLVALRRRGYRTVGPTVRDGAIVGGPITTVDDLPRGWHDRQGPGAYRLEATDDPTYFSWAVGPTSWKPEFFPADQRVWHAARDPDVGPPIDDDAPVDPVAIVGARPCDLAALVVLDRVLAGGAVVDDRYLRRRRAALVVAVECGTPADTCFCPSMGTGPDARTAFDLALTELPGPPPRYVVRVGSDHGAAVLADLNPAPARSGDLEARTELLAAAAGRIRRRFDTDGLADRLARNLEHRRWADVADRCLACGNCTLVCPTCFCSDVTDISDLDGTVVRSRRWASCFDLNHSYLHGGAVRPSIRSRYRQWLTHKLSTWWDQFQTSGCVGCGRCIAWCPVGIDLTEEAAALRADDRSPAEVGPP